MALDMKKPRSNITPRFAEFIAPRTPSKKQGKSLGLTNQLADAPSPVSRSLSLLTHRHHYKSA